MDNQQAPHSPVPITGESLERMSYTPHLNLPGVQATASYKLKHSDALMVVACQPENRKAQVCPHCKKSTALSIHGYLPTDRIVHDVNLGNQQLVLLVRTPRWRCETCKQVFTHVYENILEGRKMTRRLYQNIQREAFKRPFSDVAKAYNLSEPTIATIFDEYVEELEAKRECVVAPRVLGIDEKHIVHAARGVFVDVETGQLLEMTKGRTKADVKGAIESMYDYYYNIEIVTMDMYSPYRSYLQEILPDVKIVVDKYHVFQALQNRVSKVRSRLHEVCSLELEYEPDIAVRKLRRDVLASAGSDRYLFKYGTSKVEEDDKRVTLMADLCAMFPEFNHLRRMKAAFEAIYEAETREEAERLYQYWKELVPPRASAAAEQWQQRFGVRPGLFLEFQSLQNTMKNWETEIFNYFDPEARVTNAATEGLNNFIERLNRIGNGMSFERLRAKALYYHLATDIVRYKIDSKLKLPDNANRDLYTIHYSGGRMNGFDFTPDPPAEREWHVVMDEPEEPPTPREPLSVLLYAPKE